MGVESYQDQLSIETPEHVALSLPVAGVGSRFLALFMDTLIQILAYALFIGLLVLLFSGISTPAQTHPASSRLVAWTMAVMIFLHFLAYWGYYTFFEAFWHGQTPGKRIFNLRVIKDSGRQITFVEAMARNLLRLVDALPTMYLLGTIVVLCNPQRKRLGDMVAGTLVVHDEEYSLGGSMGDAGRTLTVGIFAPESPSTTATPTAALFPATAIARLSASDLVMLDTFFARIPELDVDTKDVLTDRLLQTLCTRMDVPAPDGVSARTALDAIAYELRNQRGFSPQR